MSEQFGFEEALTRMKAGERVRRAGWRPGMTIFIVGLVILQHREGDARAPWKWALDQDCVVSTDWEGVK